MFIFSSDVCINTIIRQTAAIIRKIPNINQINIFFLLLPLSFTGEDS